MPQALMLKKLKLNGSVKTYKTFRKLTPKKKNVILECKIGSQEIPGVTGKFCLGIQIEAGQRLTEFCQENTLVIVKPSSNNTNDDYT